MKNLIQNHIQASIDTKQTVLTDVNLLNQLQQATELCITSLANQGKILFAGNGGSAADAQHFAAELVGRYGFDRPGLPAVALTTDTSALTAIGNDYGYEAIFARQVQALGLENDVFVGISTSGNSANVLLALQVARQQGLKTIGFTGRDGGQMPDYCDVCMIVPAAKTAAIQETHLMFGHILCDLIESSLFKAP